MADSLTLSFRPIFLEDIGTSSTLSQTTTSIMGVGNATVTPIVTASSDSGAASAGLNPGDVYILTNAIPNRLHTNLANFQPSSIITQSITNSGPLNNSGLATLTGGVAVNGQNIQLQNASLDLNNQSVIGNGLFSGTITQNGELNINGGATLGSGINLNGQTINGAGTFTGNDTFTGTVTMSGPTNLNGGTTLGSGLNLNGQTVSGNATLSGNTSWTGNPTFSGNATFSGTIAFPPSYSPSFGSSNTFTGTTTFSGPVVASNTVSMSGTNTISGNTTFSAPTAFSANISVGNGITTSYSNSTNAFGSQRIYTDTSNNLVLDSAASSGAWTNALKVTSAGVVTLNPAKVSYGSYTTYSPTISAILGGGGSISGVSSSEEAYLRMGPLVHVSLEVTFTAGATPPTGIQVTPPSGLNPLHGFAFSSYLATSGGTPVLSTCQWGGVGNPSFLMYATLTGNTTYGVYISALYAVVS